MVKLASVRATRTYGPRDGEAACEFGNAMAYLVASVMALAGFVLLLPGFDNRRAALVVLVVALVLIVLVNLHDLYAQVAGVDYRWGVLVSDPQLALVEVGAPLVHTIGAILLLIALLFLLQTKMLGFGDGRQLVAMRLLVAGSVFWLLGSLHNACQVYERTGLLLQLCQKAVYLPFLLASTLYLISSVLWLRAWPAFVIIRKAQYAAATLAIVASVLLVLGALANITRVGYMRRLAAQEGSPRINNLRGGRERLEMERGEHARPLLHEQVGGRVPSPASGVGEVVEEPFTYREALVR